MITADVHTSLYKCEDCQRMVTKRHMVWGGRKIGWTCAPCYAKMNKNKEKETEQ